MPTLARAEYLDSQLGEVRELPHAGSTLENPFVYDAVARDLKEMAELGLLEIVAEVLVAVAREPLIGRLSFRRLR